MFESMSRVQSMNRARFPGFPVFWRCGACLSTYITYMGYLGLYRDSGKENGKDDQGNKTHIKSSLRLIEASW